MQICPDYLSKCVCTHVLASVCPSGLSTETASTVGFWHVVLGGSPLICHHPSSIPRFYFSLSCPFSVSLSDLGPCFSQLWKSEPERNVAKLHAPPISPAQVFKAIRSLTVPLHLALGLWPPLTPALPHNSPDGPTRAVSPLPCLSSLFFYFTIFLYLYFWHYSRCPHFSPFAPSTQPPCLLPPGHLHTVVCVCGSHTWSLAKPSPFVIQPPPLGHVVFPFDMGSLFRGPIASVTTHEGPRSHPSEASPWRKTAPCLPGSGGGEAPTFPAVSLLLWR